MNSRLLIALTALVAATTLGACGQDSSKAAADAKKAAVEAAEKAKESAVKAAEATKEAAKEAADATKDAASKAASLNAPFVTDKRATEGYRRHLVGTLVRRAIETAVRPSRASPS